MPNPVIGWSYDKGLDLFLIEWSCYGHGRETEPIDGNWIRRKGEINGKEREGGGDATIIP